MEFQMAKDSGMGSTLFTLLIAFILAGLFIFFMVMFFTSRSYKLTADDGRLKITSVFYNTDIALDDVIAGEIGLVDYKSLNISVRTNGIGMPGMQIGWFRGTAGKYKLYVTDKTKVLRIPTKLGYDILFSTPQADEITSLLRAQ